jgi:hypothetical protein
LCDNAASSSLINISKFHEEVLQLRWFSN